MNVIFQKKHDIVGWTPLTRQNMVKTSKQTHDQIAHTAANQAVIEPFYEVSVSKNQYAKQIDE